MKHHVDSSQLKGWLITTGIVIFLDSLLEPIGRFYVGRFAILPNDMIIRNIFILPILYCLYKIFSLSKKHHLKTYGEILDFINGKEKVKRTFLQESLKGLGLLLAIWVLIILGQAIGALLFFK
ncbi:hypothetical protein ACVR1G_09400 [Streptococcus dentasini]